MSGAGPWVARTLLAACILLVATDGGAQTPAGILPLAIPVGEELQCRFVPPDSSPGVRVPHRLLEVVVSGHHPAHYLPDERTIRLAVDSAGKPIMLVDAAIAFGGHSGVATAHSVAARFSPTGEVTGTRSGASQVIGEAGKIPSSRPPKRNAVARPHEKLTADEQAAVRKVAAWVMGLGCWQKLGGIR